MTKLRLFFLSLLLTTGVLMAVIYVHRPKNSPSRAPELVYIANGLFLTSQLKPENMRALKARGIKTIVDIRPDGEAKDQASSSQIAFASKDNGLAFHYIPVPHESIPNDAVDALKNVLSRETMPAVLYCRTGRRAVRLFALVEASRVDGPSTDAIIGMVRAAGFSADDLRDDIAERLSHRSSTQAANN